MAMPVIRVEEGDPNFIVDSFRMGNVPSTTE